ncbi:branched chain amino acid aminotransferase [Hyalomma marginatum]|uniref:Branched chain amino acid aminotransferase n=1 Tax=Hyalomma marginatum TaxID=34627 RepID=A0A8S4BVB6_9ACAR|nr:branched chain amino acid aminotransferase [Hyalomma marginatum]CAG7597875.1 branched chain amino acid aminotransferase [Hyalomma marginatum]
MIPLLARESWIPVSNWRSLNGKKIPMSAAPVHSKASGLYMMATSFTPL